MHNDTLMKTFDTIVIGSGISGLNFALRAADRGDRVLVITKKKIAESSTNYAQGGIAAVLSELDNFDKHVEDTLIAGAHHNNVRAVKYMVKHGPAAIARLTNLGVPFAREEGEGEIGGTGGKLLLTKEGGHRERRIAFVSDYTGNAIETALVKNVRTHKNITLYEHTFAVDLLVKNKTCYGVQVLRAGRFENVFGTTVVLATGGIGQLYATTTNPKISTGDGLGMAARAGCAFRDMEFIQFHPTALKYKNKPSFLISEAVRGEGAFLLTTKGARFMQKVHPMAELAPRDIVARAIFAEEQHGQVYLDMRHKTDDYLATRFPQIYQTLKKYGISMSKDLIPISPAAHYLCGGIKVNLHGETGIAHLYAFGEVAGTGVQGANRLASNSLLEALVFSDRIIKDTAKKTSQARAPHFGLPKATPLTASHKRSLKTMRHTLQKTMSNEVSIVRTKQGLLRAQRTITDLQKQLTALPLRAYSSLELANMLTAALLITKAALARKKSLGCHYMA